MKWENLEGSLGHRELFTDTHVSTVSTIGEKQGDGLGGGKPPFLPKRGQEFPERGRRRVSGVLSC